VILTRTSRPPRVLSYRKGSAVPAFLSDRICSDVHNRFHGPWRAGDFSNITCGSPNCVARGDLTRSQEHGSRSGDPIA
jgi:hypothetical protein